MDTYKIISEKSSGVYKEKGSKFWAYAFPFNNINNLANLISTIKKLHPHSNHYCYAYIIGIGDNKEFRVNDDGEPSGTAGLPILNQIKSEELTNVLIIVARDYGGTKLGVSGLIKAYKIAVKESLKNAQIKIKKEQLKLLIHFDFDILGEVMSILDRNNINVYDSEYSSSINFEIHINKEDFENQKTLFQHLPLNIKCEAL